MELRYYRLYPIGEGSAVHLEGPVGDAYTLCGMDTAGDPGIYSKPPKELPSGNHRLTCSHCLEIIKFVKAYLASKTPRK